MKPATLLIIGGVLVLGFVAYKKFGSTASGTVTSPSGVDTTDAGNLGTSYGSQIVNAAQQAAVGNYAPAEQSLADGANQLFGGSGASGDDADDE